MVLPPEPPLSGRRHFLEEVGVQAISLKADMRPLVGIDFETTGTSILEDRIVQIGLYFPNKERQNVEVLVNPETYIPEAATAVHGISDEMVSDKPTFRQYSKSLLEMINGCDFVGFNLLGFDIPILVAEFQRAGIEWDPSAHQVIDVMPIYMALNPRTLGAAVKQYCGRDHTDAHSALQDAKAAFDVMRGILDKHPEMPRTVPELSAVCRPSDRVDFAGKLILIKGEVCYAFGRHRGTPVIDEPEYAEWMLSTDFPPQTKKVLRDLLIAEGLMDEDDV